MTDRRFVWTFLTAALIVGSLLSVTTSTRAAGPEYFLYQVPLPLAPRSGDEALKTLDSRARPLLAALACGSELDFAQKFGEASEDSTALAIAKFEWAAGHLEQQGFPRITDDCHFSRVVLPHEVCPFFAVHKCDEAGLKVFAASNEWKDLREGRFQALNDNLKIRYSPYCNSVRGIGRDGVIRASAFANPADHKDIAARIDFAIERDCLLAQVNISVYLMKVVGQMGTNGVPCAVFSSTKGDWDMSVRNLTRLAYLDKRYNLLNPLTRQNLQDNLLTADGGPAEESYSLIGCGNIQQGTGSSQERADEREWIDDVGDWLEDLFAWALKLFLIILVIIVMIVVTIATLGAGTVAVIAAVVLAAGAGVVTGIAVNADVPETENHLLMINTSKYLKNQFIIADLGTGSDDAMPFEDDQSDLKEWLLGRMQGFLKRDFIEYNSRPYQRLSMVSILNIADFANDEELRNGAKVVLDYVAAKFAVGSHQGRRFIPLRRLREALRDSILPNPDKFNGLFDQVTNSEYQVGLNLLYAGQTQHLPGGSRASFGAAGNAVYAATSFYRPEPLIIDLAIRKDIAVYQRIHHFTSEIYSSGKSFLISAGGTATGLPYSGTGIEALDKAIVPKLKNDEGLALPTVLFLSNQRIDSPMVPPPSGTDRSTLQDLIAIEGKRPTDSKFPSYDHNLCVWDGFACGINIVVPPKFGPGNDNCLQKPPAPAAQQWEFIDSSQCTSFAQAPRFFIALYRQACPNSSNGCEENFGFFEIIDATATDSFNTFKSNVLAANPPGFISGVGGTYKSARGQTIVFSAEANQNDEDKSGITSIDGVVQGDIRNWPFAGGDAKIWAGTEAPLKSTGDGFVEIWNPRLGIRMDLDFRDKKHPNWTVH